MGRFAHLAYTDSVRRVQREQGSDAAGDRRLRAADSPDPLTADEAAFIESRDGCYLASVSETGWPYAQFKGGPPGFLHVLDERTIGYADVRGNRQYISTGNVLADGRVSLFLMDYPQQIRLKILGRASVRRIEDEPALAERLRAGGTPGPVERLVLIRVEGFDWNCPRHITPRYSVPELEELLKPLQARLDSLLEENRRLKHRLGEPG
ncbi:pyridoxamine 5'-phosphate oxidase family protein [Kitasatospora sp. NPDC056327]|uniref:pyridoxamine 5'-phosphate oxidase family protein n=1 Tax=Kitasatospora sp. NPDC056327 TaxID=3345785 RepID=UPI0035D8D0D7